MLVSVFTPTFNRIQTLPLLYDSLVKQTFTDFEWIIVNDGSSDETETEVQKWILEQKIQIQYISQSNNGKHIAMNRAVQAAKGELFTTVDSDDQLFPDALETLVNTWKSFPREDWSKYASVKSDSADLATGKKLGPTFKNGILICNYLDARYKWKINYEMQSLTRIEVLKEFPNPEILGGPNNGGLRFYPETIWQDLAGRKYETIFIDKCTRRYRMDSRDSLRGRGKKYNRSRENIYLWAHIINDNMDFFFYSPKEFIKAFVGVSMDGFFNKFTVKEVLSRIRGFWKKTAVIVFYPAGYVCYRIRL